MYFQRIQENKLNKLKNFLSKTLPPEPEPEVEEEEEDEEGDYEEEDDDADGEGEGGMSALLEMALADDDGDDDLGDLDDEGGVMVVERDSLLSESLSYNPVAHDKSHLTGAKGLFRHMSETFDNGPGLSPTDEMVISPLHLPSSALPSIPSLVASARAPGSCELTQTTTGRPT